MPVSLLLLMLVSLLLLLLLLLLLPVRLSSPLSSLTLATPSPTVWIKSSSQPSLHSVSQTLPKTEFESGNSKKDFPRLYLYIP